MKAEFPSTLVSSLQQAWSTGIATTVFTSVLMLRTLHSCFAADLPHLYKTWLESSLDPSQKPNAWKAGCSLYSLISFWADSCGLVILGTVNVRAVVKCTIPAADRSATTLVDKVPVEASVGPVLSALVLHEERALLRAELLQVTADRNPKSRILGLGWWLEITDFPTEPVPNQSICPRGARRPSHTCLDFPLSTAGWELLVVRKGQVSVTGLVNTNWKAKSSWNCFVSSGIIAKRLFTILENSLWEKTTLKYLSNRFYL